MTRTALLPLALLASLASAVGCSQDDEIVYEQFNATDDTIEVEVGVEELLPARTESLYSSTGEVVVGEVTVDPGGGPIGTNHDIVVIVTNEDPDYWASEIDRVSVRTSPPDDARAIAEDEYDLEQDSASEGYWKITLESVGDPGEVRTDTLTVRLWRIDEAAMAAEAADEETTDAR
jgi:hypothetical protein